MTRPSRAQALGALFLCLSACAGSPWPRGWNEDAEALRTLRGMGSKFMQACFARDADATFAATLFVPDAPAVEIEGRFTAAGEELAVQGLGPLAEPLFLVRWNAKGARLSGGEGFDGETRARFGTALSAAGNELSASDLHALLCGLHLFPEAGESVALPEARTLLNLDAPGPRGWPQRYRLDKKWRVRGRKLAAASEVELTPRKNSGKVQGMGIPAEPAILRARTEWRARGLLWDTGLGRTDWEGHYEEGSLTPSRLRLVLGGRPWVLALSDFAASPRD